MLRWIHRWSARMLGEDAPAPVATGPVLLDAYLRLGRPPGQADALEPRLELMVGQLSAELSGCRWCAEAGRHRWRKALLPLEALDELHAPSGARCFSERERAALGFAAAVAEGAETDGLVSGPALAEVRRHFPERAIVRLTVLAAGEHFGDCLAARLAGRPRPSFPIGVRGLS